MVNMDGTSPSGFTASSYKGMDNKDWMPAAVEDKGDGKVNSLGDMFAEARDAGNFFLVRLAVRCFFINPMVCFLPWRWTEKEDKEE